MSPKRARIRRRSGTCPATLDPAAKGWLSLAMLLAVMLVGGMSTTWRQQDAEGGSRPDKAISQRALTPEWMLPSGDNALGDTWIVGNTPWVWVSHWTGFRMLHTWSTGKSPMHARRCFHAFADIYSPLLNSHSLAMSSGGTTAG